jgi:7,8-dihydropterin-6-yl-methyl-4-(beta-D-ribofuranosyl)aminobenzene 5'-phosphate synthase
MKRDALFLAAAFLAAAAVPAAGAGGEGEAMLDSLTLTVVYDNTEPLKGFEAQWGFSCLVGGCGETILFDTGGKGDVLMNNLAAAGVDPSSIDRVVLSHVHWDHIGGLSSFLAENGGVTVYVPASFPDDVKEDIAGECGRLVEVSGPVEIIPGVWSTGDMAGPVREQSLAIRTGRGTVVLTGCAHPGVDRIVMRAREVAGSDVFCVMGGFHLGGASAERLDAIASVFDSCGVKYCGASHCTGEESMAYFAKRYGERYIGLGAGKAVRAMDLP